MRSVIAKAALVVLVVGGVGRAVAAPLEVAPGKAGLSVRACRGERGSLVDAEIFLDGALITNDGWFFRGEITPGRHVVTARAVGFDDFTREVDLVMGRTLAVDASLTPITAPLRLQSNPPGALVFIDNKPVGRTPIAGHSLDWGPHTIAVSKDDHVMEEFVVNIVGHEHAPIQLTLQPRKPFGPPPGAAERPYGSRWGMGLALLSLVPVSKAAREPDVSVGVGLSVVGILRVWRALRIASGLNIWMFGPTRELNSDYVVCRNNGSCSEPVPGTVQFPLEIWLPAIGLGAFRMQVIGGPNYEVRTGPGVGGRLVFRRVVRRTWSDGVEVSLGASLGAQHYFDGAGSWTTVGFDIAAF